MTARQLSFEDFADKIGDVFPISDANVPQIPLTLAEAERVTTKGLPPGMRLPFSLIFVARDPRVLPQRMYNLEHNGLSRLEIFLVPIGKDAEGVSYQAMFS